MKGFRRDQHMFGAKVSTEGCCSSKLNMGALACSSEVAQIGTNNYIKLPNKNFPEQFHWFCCSHDNKALVMGMSRRPASQPTVWKVRALERSRSHIESRSLYLTLPISASLSSPLSLCLPLSRSLCLSLALSLSVSFSLSL